MTEKSDINGDVIEMGEPKDKSKSDGAEYTQIKLNLHTDCVRWVDSQKIYGESRTLCVQRLLQEAYAAPSVSQREVLEKLASDIAKLSMAAEKTHSLVKEVNSNLKTASNALFKKLQSIPENLSKLQKPKDRAKASVDRIFEVTLLVLAGAFVALLVGR